MVALESLTVEEADDLKSDGKCPTGRTSEVFIFSLSRSGAAKEPRCISLWKDHDLAAVALAEVRLLAAMARVRGD